MKGPEWVSEQTRWLWPAYVLTAFGFAGLAYFLLTIPPQGDPAMLVLLLANFSFVGAFHFFFAYARYKTSPTKRA